LKLRWDGETEINRSFPPVAVKKHFLRLTSVNFLLKECDPVYSGNDD